eukprot:XP_001709315.1 Hypothetical protein GL50803_32091 [Giardia lamblia ATCC 50803]
MIQGLNILYFIRAVLVSAGCVPKPGSAVASRTILIAKPTDSWSCFSLEIRTRLSISGSRKLAMRSRMHFSGFFIYCLLFS